MGALLGGSAVVGSATPAAAETTQCAPEQNVGGVADPVYGWTSFTLATWCDNVRTNTTLNTQASRVYRNTSSAEVKYTASFEMERKVEVTGGFDAGIISASLGGGLSGKDTQSTELTLKPGGEATVNVFEKGTYYDGHQYRFPTGDRYCWNHPLSYCTRSNFTVKRFEFLEINVAKFEPKLAIQFGLGGACVQDCEDPHYAELVPLTMNVNLASGTYFTGNPWGQREDGSLQVDSPSKLQRHAIVTTGTIRDTEFTVSYNDAGTPVQVRYRYVVHDGVHARKTDWITTLSVIGF
ncbi:hypothetical protein ACFO0M_17135 [Micromonospora mangrovi]|uniref:Uncharacterized protein n=2 Tax=Micromonospora TaxID=1873 RepID=A0AAU8HHJ3_9ACTN